MDYQTQLLNTLNYAGYLAEEAMEKLSNIEKGYETFEKQAAVEEDMVLNNLSNAPDNVAAAGLFYLSKDYQDSIDNNAYFVEKQAALEELESAKAIYADTVEKLAALSEGYDSSIVEYTNPISNAANDFLAKYSK